MAEMNSDERESIELELQREPNFLARQKLMKRLWRLAHQSTRDETNSNAIEKTDKTTPQADPSATPPQE